MNTYHTDLTNKSKHLFTKQKWSAEFNNKSLFLKFFVLLFLEKKTIKRKSNKTRLPVSITKLMDQSSNTATVAHQWHLDHSCWGFSSFLYYPKRGIKGKEKGPILPKEDLFCQPAQSGTLWIWQFFYIDTEWLAACCPVPRGSSIALNTYKILQNM